MYQLGQTDMVSDIQLLTQLQKLEVKVKLCPILKTKYEEGLKVAKKDQRSIGLMVNGLDG